MTVSLPADPRNGYFMENRIRTATINGVVRVCGYDVSRLLFNPVRSNPIRYLEQYAKTQQSENNKKLTTFTFPNSGDKDAYVLDAQELVDFINTVPGINAAKFRSVRAGTVVREIGGSDALIKQIKLDPVQEDSTDVCTPKKHGKRKWDAVEIELHEKVTRIACSQVETIGVTMDLLRAIEGETSRVETACTLVEAMRDATLRLLTAPVDEPSIGCNTHGICTTDD